MFRLYNSANEAHPDGNSFIQLKSALYNTQRPAPCCYKSQHLFQNQTMLYGLTVLPLCHMQDRSNSKYILLELHHFTMTLNVKCVSITNNMFLHDTVVAVFYTFDSESGLRSMPVSVGADKVLNYTLDNVFVVMRVIKLIFTDISLQNQPF